LRELAAHSAVLVNVSITTLDPELAKALEPRASPPSRRLAAIEELTAAGIPARVLMAPMIPGLNDHEMPALLAAAAKAGAIDAGFVPLRLPWTVAPISKIGWNGTGPARERKCSAACNRCAAAS
jgi:DNA repair photolyase